jgi:hypothetical protein
MKTEYKQQRMRRTEIEKTEELPISRRDDEESAEDITSNWPVLLCTYSDELRLRHFNRLA